MLSPFTETKSKTFIKPLTEYFPVSTVVNTYELNGNVCTVITSTHIFHEVEDDLYYSDTFGYVNGSQFSMFDSLITL